MPQPRPPDLLHAQACLIDALSMSLQMRDAYTRHHCDRVGLLAPHLALHCDLDEDACAQVGLAARFHDIGKIGIPDEVLLSPRRHSDEERAIMREHPVRGEHIFLATGRSDAAPVARLIRAHHEAFDGSGYPDGLHGESIPLGARIVAIADAYDAMINDRPYKRAISHEQAISELRRHAGTQFDPELVELFCDLYADHAPEPDATVLAMSAGDQAHRQAPLIVPDVATPRPTGRKRRVSGETPQAPGPRADGSRADGSRADGSRADGAAASGGPPIAESRTMAPDGSLGLAPPVAQIVPTFPVVPPSSPPSTSRGRRTDSAAG